MKAFFLPLALAAAIYGAEAQANVVPESIYGYFMDASGVSVQVNSEGCSDKTQFTVVRLNEGMSPAQLALVRTKADPCRKPLPYGQVLKFAYDELGLKEGDTYIIVNPRKPVLVSY